MTNPYKYGLSDRVEIASARFLHRSACDPISSHHAHDWWKPCGNCVSSVTDAGTRIFDPEPVKLAVEV